MECGPSFSFGCFFPEEYIMRDKTRKEKNSKENHRAMIREEFVFQHANILLVKISAILQCEPKICRDMSYDQVPSGHFSIRAHHRQFQKR